MDTPISNLTAAEIAAAVRSRHLSAREVTWAALRRAEALDPTLGCFLLRDDAGALAQAAAVDEALANPRTAPDLPLCGVPVALKDNLITAGLPTTCGSRILQNFIPPYDATAVTRLRRAGAVLLGKLNMDEFAMGSSGENSSVRPCRNPWDPDRVPGGSSSGGAAAVAAGLLPLALGSDTGGSIRQPAALCGITGMKPTYGRVSRHGLVAFASSLDQIGPLCRTATDAALCLSVIGGHDPLDATSLLDPQPPPAEALASLAQADVRGLRIGLPEEYFGEGLDPQVEALIRQALATLEAAGAELRPLRLPMTRHAVAAYYLIATAEASSNLARYDGVRYGLRAGSPGQGLTEMIERTRSEGFGPEVKRRILLGTYVLRSGYYDAYYRRASQVRTLIRKDFLSAFATCDVIATPTSPVAAFPLGARVQDPLSMYLADVYTLGANLAGLPGISVPCGLVGPPAATSAGRPLPVGLQLLGAPRGDEVVLRAAAAYQRLTDWHTRRPAPMEAA
jgi:aspartyl-tRNA(Asn)/glutamyl-tRNA(Gln) amidotransferase subunit A